MSVQYRYKLEQYKGRNTRHICPACSDKRRTFSKYIDIETGEYVSEIVGRCNREDNCGYHYTPKEFHNDYLLSDYAPTASNYKAKPIEVKEPDTINREMFLQSLKHPEKNNFSRYLIDHFGSSAVMPVLEKYSIGSSRHWSGSTVFWQVTKTGEIRTGKVMLYNTELRRVKQPFNHIEWVHSVLKLENYELKTCLFGEHLLSTEKGKPIGIVESEKTAIVCALFIPHFTWLATGGSGNLSQSKMSVIGSDCPVVLFPDLGMFEKWTKKAAELETVLNVSVSDMLEKLANEDDRRLGYDLADFLLLQNPSDFEKIGIVSRAMITIDVGAKSETIPANMVKRTAAPMPERQPERTVFELPIKKTATADYTDRFELLMPLCEMLSGGKLPATMELSCGVYVENLPAMVESHLAMKEAYQNSKAYEPYLERLETILSTIKNKVA